MHDWWLSIENENVVLMESAIPFQPVEAEKVEYLRGDPFLPEKFHSIGSFHLSFQSVELENWVNES